MDRASASSCQRAKREWWNISYEGQGEAHKGEMCFETYLED